ncbi:MAG: PfkB family carbohydrate kinase, partial [Oscillospiraceae bacterium]
VYVGENECYRLTTSSVSVKSTIGAGDTTLAAFIHSLQEEKSLSEALMFAIAAGTASVTLDGTDIVTLQDIKNRLPHIILRMI